MFLRRKSTDTIKDIKNIIKKKNIISLLNSNIKKKDIKVIIFEFLKELLNLKPSIYGYESDILEKFKELKITPENFFENIISKFILKQQKTKEEVIFLTAYLLLMKDFINLMKKSENGKVDKHFAQDLQVICNKINFEKHSSNYVLMRFGEKGKKAYINLSGEVDILIKFVKPMKITDNDYLYYLANLIKYREYGLLNAVVNDNYTTYPIIIEDDITNKSEKDDNIDLEENALNEEEDENVSNLSKKENNVENINTSIKEKENVKDENVKEESNEKKDTKKFSYRKSDIIISYQKLEKPSDEIDLSFDKIKKDDKNNKIEEEIQEEINLSNKVENIQNEEEIEQENDEDPVIKKSFFKLNSINARLSKKKAFRFKATKLLSLFNMYTITFDHKFKYKLNHCSTEEYIKRIDVIKESENTENTPTKIFKEFKIYNYLKVISRSTGALFGEIALSDPLALRTASILTSNKCYFGTLNKKTYNETLKSGNERILKGILNFILKFEIFYGISQIILYKKYFTFFSQHFENKGSFLVKEGNLSEKKYLLREGVYEMTKFSSFLELTNLLLYYYKKDQKKYNSNIFQLEKKTREINYLIKDNLKFKKFFTKKRIIRICEMNCPDISGFDDVLSEDKKWAFSILCKGNKNECYEIKNESFLEMKIKDNFIETNEKKYVEKKLDYITNRLEIILFSQFCSFFENSNKKFIFDFVNEELINEDKKDIFYKNFLGGKKNNSKEKTQIEFFKLKKFMNEQQQNLTEPNNNNIQRTKTNIFKNNIINLNINKKNYSNDFVLSQMKTDYNSDFKHKNYFKSSDKIYLNLKKNFFKNENNKINSNLIIYEQFNKPSKRTSVILPFENYSVFREQNYFTENEEENYKKEIKNYLDSFVNENKNNYFKGNSDFNKTFHDYIYNNKNKNIFITTQRKKLNIKPKNIFMNEMVWENVKPVLKLNTFRNIKINSNHNSRNIKNEYINNPNLTKSLNEKNKNTKLRMFTKLSKVFPKHSVNVIRENHVKTVVETDKFCDMKRNEYLKNRNKLINKSNIRLFNFFSYENKNKN
jgi:hypothetical protein